MNEAMDESQEKPQKHDKNKTMSSQNLSPDVAAAVHSALEGEKANVELSNKSKAAGATGHATDLDDVTEAMVDDAILQFQEATQKTHDDDRARIEEEAAKLKDQLIRAVAETENIRKRSERDLADLRKYAVTGFARDLVNVVEHLQMALQNIPENARKEDEKLSNLAQGVEMTYNELLRVFEGHGIMRVDPKGEKFNHNHHQAVAQIDSADVEPGHVVQVLQAGYIIHDRLLRPAMVTVAKEGSKAQSVDTEA